MYLKIRRFLWYNLEALIWLTALILFTIMPPNDAGASMCMFHVIGIDSCPGCGIGHSISAALHGNLGLSLRYHPLGIFAVLVLLMRIISVFVSQSKYQKLKNEIYDKNL